jgi:tetratricopeptide (TPR) repeat protein
MRMLLAVTLKFLASISAYLAAQFAKRHFYDLAAQLFDVAKLQSISSHHQLKRAAITYHQVGRWEVVDNCLNYLQAVAPGEATNLFKVNLLLRERKFEAALNVLTNTQHLRPSIAKTALAKTLLGLGSLHEALALLEQVRCESQDASYKCSILAARTCALLGDATKLQIELTRLRQHANDCQANAKEFSAFIRWLDGGIVSREESGGTAIDCWRTAVLTGNLSKAESVARQILRQRRYDMDSHYILAATYAAAGQGLRATETLDLARHIGRRSAVYWARIGHLQAWSRKLDIARISLQRSLRLSPSFPLALADIAFCNELAGNIRAATVQYRLALRAFKQRPNPISRLPGLDEPSPARITIHYLSCLGLAKGATLVNRRAATHLPDPCTALQAPELPPRWTGQTYVKRVALIADKGIGDEIRNWRFLPGVLEKANRVTLTADPRLAELIQRTLPHVRVVPVARQFKRAAPAEFQFKIEIPNPKLRSLLDRSSLDLLRQCDAAGFLSSLEWQLKAPPPPLGIPCQSELLAMKRWLATLPADLPKIGVSWRGALPGYQRSPFYYNAIDWMPLFADKTICCINLQYGWRDEEIRQIEDAGGCIYTPPIDLRNSLETVAALVSLLDLVISIPTAILELTGFMGTPSFYVARTEHAVVRWRNMAGRDRIWPAGIIDIAHSGETLDSNIRRIHRQIKGILSSMPTVG